jgi:hypothetical protein
MSRTSSSKTVSSVRRAAPRDKKGAASKAPSKNKALQAKAEPVITQELKGGRVPSAVWSNHPQRLAPGLQLLGLMTRTISASRTIPMGMARCRTPFEMWSRQSKFFQGITTDCQTVTFSVMNAFNAFPDQGPKAKSKKRRKAHSQR